MCGAQNFMISEGSQGKSSKKYIITCTIATSYMEILITNSLIVIIIENKYGQ